MDITALESSTGKASTLLKSLGNEQRLLILVNLQKGEKSVSELKPILKLSQSALSQHLARLRRDKLVQTRRVSQTIYYSISCDAAICILGVLCKVYCSGVQPPS